MRLIRYYLILQIFFSISYADEITKYINKAIVSDNNKHLAISSYSNHTNTVSLWDSSTFPYKMIKTFDFNDNTSINDIVFSHNNIFLAAGINNEVYIWDVKTHKLLEKLKNYHAVSSIKFSEDDKYLIVGGQKDNIFVWNAKDDFSFVSQIDGEAPSFIEKLFPKTLFREGISVTAINFSQNGHLLIVSYEDKKSQIFDINENFKKIKVLANEENLAYEVFFRNKFIITSSDNISEVFDSKAPFEKKKVLKDLSQDLYSAALSKDNKYYITSGGYSGLIRIWDTNNDFKEIAILEGHEEYTTSLQFFKDDKYILSAGGDDSVKIWKTENYDLVAKIFINDKNNLLFQDLKHQ